MWPQMLTICSLLVGSVVYGLQFHKCCPEGEIVYSELKNTNGLSSNFKCQKSSGSVKIKSKRESESYDFENIANTRGMVSYNVLSDVHAHWPSCTTGLSSTIVNHSLKASVSSSCVDVMNSNYYLFTCDNSSKVSKDFLNIYKNRKCCGNNYLFDITSRQCVFVNETAGGPSEFFDFFGNKSVIFETGIPNCNADDVLVEYTSNLHKLKIYENSLIITATEKHGPDVFIHGSYCIENAVTSNSASDSSLEWISKVCRPKDICSEIPCLRKCCKEGLRMVILNGSTFCEPHGKHLKVNLHHFDSGSSPENPEKIEPTGEHLSIEAIRF